MHAISFILGANLLTFRVQRFSVQYFTLDFDFKRFSLKLRSRIRTKTDIPSLRRCHAVTLDYKFYVHSMISSWSSPYRIYILAFPFSYKVYSQRFWLGSQENPEKPPSRSRPTFWKETTQEEREQNIGIPSGLYLHLLLALL